MKTMKFRKFALSSLTVLTLLASCSRDEDPAPKPDPKPDPPVTTITPDKINDFVWKAMNSWYYWQKEAPNLGDTKFATPNDYATFINGKSPDKLFYELLFEYGKTDLFSWIENDNEIVSKAQYVAEEQSTSGLEIAVLGKGDGSGRYVALVNYIIPKSSADKAGLKRGDVITKVNGQYLVSSNYSQLFGASFSLTRAETASYNDASGVISTTDKDESIAIVKTMVEENPIAFYKVFKEAGRTIGYLVFNGFKIDYNDELNAQFAQMKADGVNELILDLRYNGGGSLDTALGLAQMINGSFTGGDYVFLDFNDKHNQYDEFDKLSDKISIYNIVDGHQEKTGEVQQINSLTLPKIYALVSFQTASASELTVTSLKKYIDVEVIGYLTVGKFVGSHTLYDSPTSDFLNYENRNKDHKWQLQPITFAYYNKDKDPHPKVRLNDGSIVPGIIPDKKENFISPFEWVGKVKEFGNPSDPELGRALEIITGKSLSANASMRSRAVLTNRGGAKLLSKPMSAAKGLYISDVTQFRKP